MKKYYHMIIQRKGDLTGETRREYISTRQGSAPNGWVCVGVCGFHEKAQRTENIILNGGYIYENYRRKSQYNA